MFHVVTFLTSAWDSFVFFVAIQFVNMSDLGTNEFRLHWLYNTEDEKEGRRSFSLWKKTGLHL